MQNEPARGFEPNEYKARHARASELMHGAGLDALWVSSEQHVRYFTGFDSQFWNSPTRPWFVIIPRDKPLIAVIPEIGAEGMASTWVDDIRTWPAPVPEDDGVSLLASALSEVSTGTGKVGAELGLEMVLRMPQLDFERVRNQMSGAEIVDGTAVLKQIRAIKSPAEIAKIRHVCGLASDSFESLPGNLAFGDSERQACKKLLLDMLRRGADSAPYVMGVSGQGGYANIIMGPTDRVIGQGDILIIDTGAIFDGYFCDFDRNFAFGQPDDAARRAYDVVFQATETGLKAAGPGATTSDLWRAMNSVLQAGGSLSNTVGRMGHGLGMQLTEGPSNKPGDDTELKPGMVMTLEPGMEFAPGKLMVHEENLVITEGGCELLSRRAWPAMPIIG
jgi:Xaa-Pro dipeptidase